MRTLKRSTIRNLKQTPTTKRDRTKKGDIVQACVIIYGEYVQCTDDLLPDDRPNPEQCAVKNDLYSKLSDDAKEVLTTIFNAPKEFVDACISPKDGRYRAFKGDRSYYIRKFFRKKWRSRLKVKSTFEEVEKYLQKIK